MFEIGDKVRAVLTARMKALGLTAEHIESLQPLKVPVWHVGDTDKFSCNLRELFAGNDALKSMVDGSQFRCVAYSIDKLQFILSCGIDINPPTGTFYASTLDKANEYGESPRILMILDGKKLANSWRILPKDATAAEREEVRREYPFSATRDDGTECFSRIKDEPHRFSTYEFNYGKWIPGNPRDALRGVVILDDALSSNPTEEEYQDRFLALMSGRVESPQCAFIRKRIEDGLYS